MGVGSLIYTVIIGCIAGWLGNKIMGKSSTLLRNIVVGVLGSIAGGFLWLPFGSGLIGSIITATIGAVIVLIIVNYLAD